MRIRRAHSTDLNDCAYIYANAFLHDELMAWLFPLRHQHYGDFHRECLREIQVMFYQPGFALYVAELEEGDEDLIEPSPIIGFASWYRHGESQTALGWHGDTIVKKIRRLLQLIITFVQNIVTPDRSADPSRLKLLGSTNLFTDIPERWHLCNIAVHPSRQRRGIARRLTKWGLEIASEERVPVTLEATISAEPLYRKMGFRDYSYNCLAEDVDGPALIWEPAGLEGSFGTNFPPRETLIGRGKGRKWKPVDAYPEGQASNFS